MNIIRKEFIYESKYDLSQCEEQIKNKIKDGLFGGIEEGEHTSLPLDRISHKIISFEKLSDKKYRIVIEIADTDFGHNAEKYIDDLRLGVVGMSKDGVKIEKFIRFDLIKK